MYHAVCRYSGKPRTKHILEFECARDEMVPHAREKKSCTILASFLLAFSFFLKQLLPFKINLKVAAVVLSVTF